MVLPSIYLESIRLFYGLSEKKHYFWPRQSKKDHVNMNYLEYLDEPAKSYDRNSTKKITHFSKNSVSLVNGVNFDMTEQPCTD